MSIGLRVGADRVAEIRLERPQRANALDLEHAREMAAHVADDLAGKAREIAATLAAGSLPAHAAVRRLLLESSTSTFAEQLELEAAEIVRLAGSEGIAAFLEKRPPNFGAG